VIHYRGGMRWIVGFFIATGLLVGCSAGDVDSGSSQMAVSEGIADAPMAAGPQVIITGSVGMRVDDPAASGEEVRRVTNSLGGTIESETMSSSDTQQFKYFTVRIPADSFDAFLANVTQLGNVVDQSITRTDVTTQALDLDAQIAALEPAVSRMKELLAQATTVADVIAAESALAERQARLDGLVAQRDYLAQQVAMATVFISLSTADGSSPSTAMFFGGALIGALLAGLGAAAIWIARRR
jgi:hypothetical protein